MRDPDRIDTILQRLGVIWKNDPDLRLTQLITNLQDGPSSIYYEEDFPFIERAEAFYFGGNDG